ncbi:hypothetical protein Tcan_11293 [Toxocara canis]|uniref:Uncharacterized protein n=1 Tax=Toxocara canis TaxID=6265 RepID=A0A0B2UX93_TOXCA|nr:hypothetical protein Tcan_11293 [Toxocara canis]
MNHLNDNSFIALADLGCWKMRRALLWITQSGGPGPEMNHLNDNSFIALADLGCWKMRRALLWITQSGGPGQSSIGVLMTSPIVIQSSTLRAGLWLG